MLFFAAAMIVMISGLEVASWYFGLPILGNTAPGGGTWPVHSVKLILCFGMGHPA